MRPDKSGYWWWMPANGNEKIAKLAKGYGSELHVIENDYSLSITQFERQLKFKFWLGQAHPPKKLNTIIVNLLDENNEPYEETVVLYDDVKEFSSK